MKCPACGVENGAGRKFCVECGTAVALNCVTCGTPYAAGEKFCGECGESLGGRGSRPSIRGKEKAATRDDREGTPTAPSGGPSSGPRVERFENFVDKFTGDGIMALCGAPIAYEDHAQRACYAALHLRDAKRRYADELRLQQGLSVSTRMATRERSSSARAVTTSARTTPRRATWSDSPRAWSSWRSHAGGKWG
jgi:class 3 adenylate cyclase